MFVKWYPFDLTSQKTNISQIYNYIFTFGMLMLFFFLFLVFLLLLILFLFLVFLSELPPKIILKPKYNWIFIKKWVKISIKLDPFSLIYINIYIYIKYAKNKIYIFMLKAPHPLLGYTPVLFTCCSQSEKRWETDAMLSKSGEMIPFFQKVVKLNKFEHAFKKWWN